MENRFEYIDLDRIFAYNRNMEEKRTKQRIFLYILRCALIVASLVTMAFIFSNSLKNGEESTQQSSGVVDFVQEVVSVVAPDSPIANATGEDYDLLHSFVRNLAHFSEFCLLGALLSWTCFSFTFKKIIQILSPLGVATVAIVDECLQLFTDERAFEFGDILLDTCGGVSGALFAIACVWIGYCIYKSKRKKKLKNSSAEIAAEERGN